MYLLAACLESTGSEIGIWQQNQMHIVTDGHLLVPECRLALGLTSWLAGVAILFLAWRRTPMEVVQGTGVGHRIRPD